MVNAPEKTSGLSPEGDETKHKPRQYRVQVPVSVASPLRPLSKGAAITNVDEKKVTESRKRKGYYRWMRLGPLKPRSKADKDITDGKLFPESG